jgi:hypothetical protein
MGMDRRTFLKGLGAAAFIPVLSAGGADVLKHGSSSTSGGSTSTGSGGSSLVFRERAYTVETTTVATSTGTKTVTYHFYRAIPYVARPVDSTYQSLDVSVPVKINGKAVDATAAPVLLDINVAGYTSSAVPSSFGDPGGISTAGGFTGNGGHRAGAGRAAAHPAGALPAAAHPVAGPPRVRGPGRARLVGSRLVTPSWRWPPAGSSSHPAAGVVTTSPQRASTTARRPPP